MITILIIVLASAEVAATLAPGAGPPFALEHGKAVAGDASPVDPGVVEAEISYAPAWNNVGHGSGATPAADGSVHAISATATFGLVRDVDVKLSGSVVSVFDAAHLHANGAAPRHGTGVGDAVAGARWRFLNLPELELAVAGQLVIPVGSRHTDTQIGASQEFWSGRLSLLATKDLGRFTFNAELALGAPLAGDARGLVAVAQTNLAAGYHLARWLQPELELNYQASFGLDAHVLAVTAGLVVPWGAGYRLVAAIQQSVYARNTVPTTSALFAYKTAL
jgi:hypothetical protein